MSNTCDKMFKLEYRAVIKFLTKEKVTPKDIKSRLDSVYGESSPSYTTVKDWAKLFRDGRESIEDDPHGGGPSTVVIEENIKLVEKIVLSDRRLKAKEIAEKSEISKSSVLRILHEHLNMSKVSARWVPRLLSAIQKQQRVDCCKAILESYSETKDVFLKSIVTGDETMVLYYDPTTKKESMEWRVRGEGAPKKAKVTQSRKKIMATIFWDMQGILLVDFLESNTTMNAAYYANLLHQLRGAIKEKRRGMLTQGIRLLHDNAPVHTAAISKSAVKECGFIELDHPPYSPDLAPSDYYLFSKLKSDLRGRRFSTDDEVKSAVLEHFESKSSDYFSRGIEMLIKRCEKCIEINGDYIEK